MGYNNEVYMRVREEFRNKSQEKQLAAEARRHELEAEIPGLAEIDRALEETSLRIWSEAVSGAPDLKERIAKIELDNLELQDARKMLLKKAGYPEDALDVKYDCDKCRDTGIVDNMICECMRKKIVAESIKCSNIASAIEKQNFDNFSLKYYEGKDRETMENSLRLVRSSLNQLACGTPVFLLFIGDTGLGKTHLSSAVAGEAIKLGLDVVYESMPDLVRAFETERFRDEGKTSKYYECDLLIIDDLGSEPQTAFATSCLYNILNSRLVADRSMLISTNLDAKKLRLRYDDRSTSRLVGEFIPVLFAGRDIRGRNKLEK